MERMMIPKSQSSTHFIFWKRSSANIFQISCFLCLITLKDESDDDTQIPIKFTFLFFFGGGGDHQQIFSISNGTKERKNNELSLKDPVV